MMAAAMQRLASVDEANLVLDHAGQVNVFLIAGLLSEGGFVGNDRIPDMAALRAVLGERIDALPQLRRIAVAAGLRHRWVESSPDLDHHIRLGDAVAGLAGLERLCGVLMNVPLPQDRPMWEILLIPGASVDAIGVVLRIHHALADGIAAVAIARQLFDPSERSATRTAAPQPHPGARAARGARNVLGRISSSLRRIGMTLSAREVGSTLLLGERSPHRGVAFLAADLASLEEYARSLGATANDALLSAVASGYRAALAAAGEVVPARLPVSVPVALRRRGSSGNQVGVMLVRLPLGEPDPDERLRLIAAQTRLDKVTARRQGTLEFMRGPIGARIMDQIARRQHLVAGFVTNVPGPAGPLRLAGAPAVAIWPVAVLAGNVRLGVAAVSYDGGFRCGIHFDDETVPGAVFSGAMQKELARLARGRVLSPPLA